MSTGVSVASIPSIAAVATPSIAETQLPQFSALDVLMRAEHMIDTLRNCFVRKDFSLEEAAAERVLKFFRDTPAPSSREYDAEFEFVVAFFHDHGQSLDWVIRGEAGVMICQVAAASERGRVNAA